MGRFVNGATLLLFVFANVRSSGGAYPPELVPQPFRFLHGLVSGTATINLLRRDVYGVGPDEWHGWVTLLCYIGAGVLLALVGRPLFVARARRHRANGHRPMTVTAQIANMAHAGYVIPVDPQTVRDQEPRTTDDNEETALPTHLPRSAPASAPAMHETAAEAPNADRAIIAEGMTVTATATSDGGPVELTLQLQAPDDHRSRHRRQHTAQHAQHRRDEEQEQDFSPEEADVDAIATETGAAG
ncbi:hypothetical protein [uncultured Curtobacterium sp.]|uniref:hypothetical protein n=1 Tax=uncultured Curtobacterium sp. TaxID=331964 RepID=UPI002590CE98|nr:hypothetical protein [uncultured Curtobacterium sp.]